MGSGLDNHPVLVRNQEQPEKETSAWRVDGVDGTKLFGHFTDPLSLPEK